LTEFISILSEFILSDYLYEEGISPYDIQINKQERYGVFKDNIFAFTTESFLIKQKLNNKNIND